MISYNAIADFIQDLRSLEHLLKQQVFLDLLERDKTLQILCDAVLNQNPVLRTAALSAIKQMVRQERRTDTSLHDLREMARVLGIKRYSRLSKAGLLSRIASRSNNGREDCCPSNGNSAHAGSERISENVSSLQET